MDAMDLDRGDTPRGWYDLVILGVGWEAIGAAWLARSLGARVALVPGTPKTEASWVSVPRPLCQRWTASLPCLAQSAPLPCWTGKPSPTESPCLNRGDGSGPRESAAEQGFADRCVLSWRPPEGPFVEGLPMGGLDLADPLPADKALGQLVAAGVRVFRGQARFQAPDVLEVEGQPIPFRKVLLALGVQAEPIQHPGIDPAELCSPSQLLAALGMAPRAAGDEQRSIQFHRNTQGPSLSNPNTQGSQASSPSSPAGPEKRSATPPGGKGTGPRVAVLGGGPQECFWAQWLARQGCQVHLLTAEADILKDEEPEVRALLQERLLREGVRIHRACRCEEVQCTGQAKALLLVRGSQREKLFVEAVLAVPQYRVDWSGLGLEAARVAWDASGVRIDSRLRTTNRRILAAGAMCGERFQCARIGWAMVQGAVENALGRGLVKRDWLLPFHCIPTDPPIVRVGGTPEEALRECWPVRTYRVQTPSPGLSGGRPGGEGFWAVHVRARSGRIVGATLVGPWAHELAEVLSFLMKRKIPLSQGFTPAPCVSEAMGYLEEAARLCLQDHRPRWWDIWVENLYHFWQKWKKRRSATSEATAETNTCPPGPREDNPEAML